jgi:hypothetical protein
MTVFRDITFLAAGPARERSRSATEDAVVAGFADIHDAPFGQLLRWWHGDDPPPPGFGEGFCDEVAYGLTRHRPDGVAVLKRALSIGDEAHQAAALEFLAYPGLADDEVRAVLLQAFTSDRQDLRSRALWGFLHLAYYPISEQQIRSLMEGEDDRMAASAMVYLSRSRPADAVPILRAALSSPNPRMREYACDEIGDRGIDALSARMVPLLGDQHADVAAAARCNLEFFEESPA